MSSTGRIGEQKVFASHDKGLHAALCQIVGDFQSAVQQIVAQPWPLL